MSLEELVTPLRTVWRFDYETSAHFGHREHLDRRIVNSGIGIVNSSIGHREQSDRGA